MIAAEGAEGLSEARGRLLQSRWLEDAPADFLEAIVGLIRWRWLADGEVLCHPGEESHGLFGVGSGYLVGEQHVLGNLNVGLTTVWHAGMWFGHASLLSDRHRRAVTRARGPAIVAVVPGHALAARLAEQPVWWREIGRLADIVTLPWAGTGQDLLRRQASQRCLAILLMLSGCRWTDPPAGEIAVAPISQQELAECSNLSRNAVGACLRPWVETGMVELGYRRIAIVDSKRLRLLLD